MKSNSVAVLLRNEVPGKVTTEKDHPPSEMETPFIASTSKTGKSLTKNTAKTSKTTEISATQINKEVFSVLRELNENHKQQSARIEQQNSKTESLSRKLDNMYENSGEYEEYDNENSENYYVYEDSLLMSQMSKRKFSRFLNRQIKSKSLKTALFSNLCLMNFRTQSLLTHKLATKIFLQS